jgi:hypothetical protein
MTCVACGLLAPAELHHVAGRRYNDGETTPVCLNCHAILTERQMRDWHPRWRIAWREREPTEREHVARLFLEQGWLDILALASIRALQHVEDDVDTDGADAQEGSKALPPASSPPLDALDVSSGPMGCATPEVSGWSAGPWLMPMLILLAILFVWSWLQRCHPRVSDEHTYRTEEMFRPWANLELWLGETA